MVRSKPEPGQGDSTPPRAALVSWKVRVAEIAGCLVERAREHGLAPQGAPAGGATDPADEDAALEDAACAPGSAGDGRSLLRAFAEDGDGLSPPEREQLLRWEKERRKAVYLVERCFPDAVEVWDPVEGARLTFHLPDRLPGARASEVARGTLVVATTVPWTTRRLARGRVEFWSDPRALPMYRNEVRSSGRAWHDLPPAAPTPR
jgi:hypothetical protein